MSKHTPKPWTLQRGIVDLHVWCGQDGAFSKSGMNDQNWDFSEKDYANGRMLAASPELFDLLKEALEDYLVECNPQDPSLESMYMCPPDHPNRCGVCDFRYRALAIIRRIEGVCPYCGLSHHYHDEFRFCTQAAPKSKSNNDLEPLDK